jgi:LysM repeat protein
LNSSSKAQTAGKSYPKGSWRTYTVRNGETLLMIARRYRVTVPDLIRANGLHRPDQILPGTKILIPESSPAPARAK